VPSLFFNPASAEMPPSSFMSAAVATRATPGIARAAPTSMLRIFAWA
jgi:hypothetical protein